MNTMTTATATLPSSANSLATALILGAKAEHPQPQRVIGRKPGESAADALKRHERIKAAAVKQTR